MDKLRKSDLLCKGMLVEFLHNQSSELIDRIIGQSLKRIRLSNKKWTAEKVVQDNKQYFPSGEIELYQLERGINTKASKVLPLIKYYGDEEPIRDILDYLKSFNEKGKKDVEKIPTKVQTWNNS